MTMNIKNVKTSRQNRKIDKVIHVNAITLFFFSNKDFDDVYFDYAFFA